MGKMSPSKADIVVMHHEDGKIAIIIDGKPVAGIISAQIVKEAGRAAVLNLSIAGAAFRLDTSPLSMPEEWAARRAAERG